MSEPNYCRAIIGMDPGVRGIRICRRTPGHEGEHRLEPDAPPREVTHGPLPDGGFWAGFCSNPDCNVLGCPGDCQGPPETQPERAATSGTRAAGGESLGGPCSECGAGQGEPCRPGCEWAEELARMHRDSVARQSRPLRPGAASASAPPTPSAPGVAALLAECARRQKLYDEQWISIKQVQRYLAPEGADDEGEGT